MDRTPIKIHYTFLGLITPQASTMSYNCYSLSTLDYVQDWLQNENMGPHVQKLRTPKSRQQSVKPKMGPSE